MLEKFYPLHWFLKFLIIGSLLMLTSWVIIWVVPKIFPRIYLRNTKVAGVIITNEHWSGEIRVVGDIWALPGTIITIDPGTKIVVEPWGDRLNLHLLPWGLRSGLNTGADWYGVKNGEYFWDESQKIQIRLARVVAVGTAQQPIVITSDHSLSDSPYDFNIISATSGIFDHIIASNYRRFLMGEGIISSSQFQKIAECAICAEYSSPTITGNIFNRAIRSYILAVGGSPVINNNLFLSNSPVGVEVDPQIWGEPEIFNNSFEMDNKIALKSDSGDEDKGGKVTENYFSGGSIIEIPCNSKLSLTQNQIRGRLKFASLGNCVGGITIGVNYWGSFDEGTIINEKILGREPDFKVLIPQILKDPPMAGRKIHN